MSADETEHEIIDVVERQGRLSQEQYQGQLDLYERRIQDASISDGAFVRVQADGEHALAMFKAQAVEDDSALSNSERELREIEGEYSDFRRANGLTKRLPINLPAPRLWGQRILIALLFLLETGVNGSFFAQGSTTGLIGGVSEAAALSFLNIALAGMQGLVAMRYVRHRSLWPKALAIAGVALLIAAALLLNIGIAHFRDLYVVAEGNVELRRALEGLLASPFGLRDVSSLWLMLIGLVLHFIAAVDFYKLSDSYPGYTTIGNRRQKTIDKYLAVKAACIESLTQHKEISIDAMKAEIDKVARHRSDYELATAGRERLHRAYVDHLAHLHRVTIRLVDGYRQANREARPPGCKAPALFDESPSVNLPSAGDLAPVPPQAADSHRRTIDTMSHYITHVNKEYAATVERFRMIDPISTPGATDASAQG